MSYKNKECRRSFDSEQKHHYHSFIKSLCKLIKNRSNKEASYATFFQTECVEVNLGDAFPFNRIGASTPDITLLDFTTIKINKSGVYNISYKIPLINNPENTLDNQRINIYINNKFEKNIQGNLALLNPQILGCSAISGDIIAYIPENSTLQIRNDSYSNEGSPVKSCFYDVISPRLNIVMIG